MKKDIGEKLEDAFKERRIRAKKSSYLKKRVDIRCKCKRQKSKDKDRTKFGKFMEITDELDGCSKSYNSKYKKEFNKFKKAIKYLTDNWQSLWW